ncbi:serine/threonine-protein phosphatase 7 long form-like protein isoform X2 [Gossypium australe]|uniref:Serine/threonine-protein phosphatase 7 long form-like protein isoform X2 n=1 Tax=Gossypium australe TaxID=47621 RepID=A0A5B6UNG1_9ROSI|nr:serine/threonine-protein phosphatase 7 long form-like protein isoform X2 [Gossypium australe]
MLGGTKLDPALISALVKRWRPETHIFHVPCGKCTITLEDVALQLGLLVDGLIITGAFGVGDLSTICEQLLGKVSNKFFDSWIKKINYIENSASAVEREQYARIFILNTFNVATITRRIEISEGTQLEINCVGDIVPRDVIDDTTTKN